jgi:hypothetical protein
MNHTAHTFPVRNASDEMSRRIIYTNHVAVTQTSHLEALGQIELFVEYYLPAIWARSNFRSRIKVISPSETLTALNAPMISPHRR